MAGAVRRSTRKSAKKKKCKLCSQEIDLRGYTEHLRACEVKNRASGEAKDRLLSQKIKDAQALRDGFLPTGFVEGSSRDADRCDPGDVNWCHYNSPEPALNPFSRPQTPDFDIEMNDLPSNTIGHTTDHELQVQLDDIKVEYHPKSRRPDKHFRFHDYTDARSPIPIMPNQEPWKPFRTRVDFELAELMLETCMNTKQSASLLSLIHRCIKDPESFTITNVRDLQKTWDHARNLKGTGFVTKTFTAPYKGQNYEFDVSTRPIWDWCCEILKDPVLIQHFRWDAERHFKFDGTHFERFIDEPWTADDWWNIQSKLPDGASPVFLIIYADKTQLSSFGTAKGYPVVARIANLPTEIRNSDGAGGGRLVGWLPIVSEDSGETGKKGYVNFKRIVWHRAFYEILDSIRLLGKVGYKLLCGDQIARWLFPLLLILSSDYEEQCIMALIRGFGSLTPCPVCLVPSEQLSNLSVAFPLRTTESMKDRYEQAQEHNVAEGDAILKMIGLRNNSFWDLAHFDPYQAISWDRLHAYHGGLFSDHIWPEFKRILESLGKKQMKHVDLQVDKVPRWSGLNHFSAVMKQEFTDGSKYEDIAKVIMFSSHNLLTEDISPAGFILLRLLRSYLELDMFSSLSVQTESTLAAGKEELKNFERIVKEYQEIYPAKSWNFPKMHSHIHLFADIIRKGVTRIYNTKPNEKAHSPLKDFYQRMTNFKDFIGQILKLNENDIVSTIIREELELLDKYLADIEMQAEDNDSSDSNTNLIGNQHVSLGSPLPASTIDFVEHCMFGEGSDHAFHDFRKRLSKSLSMIQGKKIRLSGQDEITPYRLLRVNYESTIDWRLKTDLLRVNPNFHNLPRFDYVIVHAGEDKHFFAQLLYVFGVFVENGTRYMALILPLDEAIPRAELVPSDPVFRFTRVRSRRRSDAAFVDINSIVRGALLINLNDGEASDEFIVFDTLDEDMWWRMKSIRLSSRVRLS